MDHAPTESAIQSVDHANPDHARTVLVDWMLGNSCNFACSYCPGNLHDGSIRWQSAEAVLGLFDAIREHYIQRLGRNVWIQFTGGEPTMHPRIVELLQEASDRGFSASLISNGARTLRFWQRIRDHLDSAILTYHSEFVVHPHFLDVARFLAEAMPVHINVTMLPDRFDETYVRAVEIVATLPSATLSLKPLREDFRDGLYPYSVDQLRRMEAGIDVSGQRDGATPRGVMVARRFDGREERTRANAFIVRGSNRWRGYECNAGLESLRVKGDGQIYRAVCASGGRLGRLGESIVLPTEAIVCDRDRCGCIADILITKWRGVGSPDAASWAAGGD